MTPARVRRAASVNLVGILVFLFCLTSRVASTRFVGGKNKNEGKSWTYNPTKDLNKIVEVSQGEQAAGAAKGGASKSGEEKKKDMSKKNCCQICPYKFHIELALLELPPDIHSAATERFKEWHANHLQVGVTQARERERSRQDASVEHFLEEESSVAKAGGTCQRPQPDYKKLKAGQPGYPGVWECPSEDVQKDAATVCCNLCPSENYPEVDFRSSSGTAPTEEKAAQLDPDAGCPTADNCGSNRKAGTNCDPAKPRCPLPPEPFPGTDAPCCTLCTEAFIPEKNDPIVREDAGDMYPTTPIAHKADEHGYFLPNLGFIQKMERVRGREHKKTQTLSSTDAGMKGFKRCCYPCAAGDYNVSPGDSVFGEPQSEGEKLRDMFRPLNIPYKNFVNQRVDYEKKDSGGLLGDVMGV